MLTPHRASALALAVAGLVAVGPTAAFAQAKPGRADARASGRTLYMEHCASCHGTSGRGDGPAADSLRARPTDLTRFARANGGVFPAERTRQTIDGRGVASHGSVEMPVWGTVFKAASPTRDGRAVQDRIDAIVAYLESIQERAGHE
ncbi:MAG: cytochrome c [Acidobacteria bacterium]|nr:cytochrome c [Acidobacteriota bacterium]